MPPSDVSDLAERLGQPNFTAGKKHVAGLVELALGDDKVAERACHALAPLGPSGVRALVLARPDQSSPAFAGWALAIANLLEHTQAPELAAIASELLLDSQAPTRAKRFLIVAVAKAASHGFTAVAQGLLRTEPPVELLRSIVIAVGASRQSDAAGLIDQALRQSSDVELTRLAAKARLMLQRDLVRSEIETTSPIDVSKQLPFAVVVRLGVKRGLGPLLLREVQAKTRFALANSPRRRSASADWLDLVVDGTWSQLFASRLWATAEMVFRFPHANADESTIARELIASPAIAVMRAITGKLVRWRLAFSGRGHQRGRIWKIANEVASQAPDLLNDPAATDWQLVIDERANELRVTPHRIPNSRLQWRDQDIPAASHPSIAAALAFLAAPAPHDTVWDPFVGSGSELIECAIAGATTLIGSDLSEESLAAARSNAIAAGDAGITADLQLHHADATRFSPRGVSLIVTNPPLGSRIVVDAPALLVNCLEHFANVLNPGGRLVWITPKPAATDPIAHKNGLQLTENHPCDLGGLAVVMQRWEKPAR